MYTTLEEEERAQQSSAPEQTERSGIALEIESKDEEEKVPNVKTRVKFDELTISNAEKEYELTIPISRDWVKKVKTRTEGFKYAMLFKYDNDTYKLLYDWETRRTKDLDKLKQSVSEKAKKKLESERKYQEFEVTIIPKWGKELEDYNFDREKTASRNADHVVDMVEHLQNVKIDPDQSIMLIQGTEYIFDPDSVEILDPVFSFCSESQGLFVNIAIYRIDRVQVSGLTFGMWVFTSNMFGKATDTWRKDLNYVERYGVEKYCVARGLAGLSTKEKRFKLEKPHKLFKKFAHVLKTAIPNDSEEWARLEEFNSRKSFYGKDLASLFGRGPRYSDLDLLAQKLDTLGVGNDEGIDDDDLLALKLDLDELEKATRICTPASAD